MQNEKLRPSDKPIQSRRKKSFRREMGLFGRADSFEAWLAADET
jgi:hypothetical protein